MACSAEAATVSYAWDRKAGALAVREPGARADAENEGDEEGLSAVLVLLDAMGAMAERTAQTGTDWRAAA